jgi:DNA-directed RNA polymerase specialized sigma24 family protein
MQVVPSTIPTIAVTDRECLEASRRHRRAENLRPLVERYLAFVYSAAHRRTGSADHAIEVTRAVFLVLGRRARKLPKKTVLAWWLFHVTGIACKKVKRAGFWDWPWPRRKPGDAGALDAPLWTRVSPRIDRALQRLWSKQRNAVLLCAFLNYDLASAARILRTRESRVEKRFTRGMKKLARRLHKRRTPVDPGALASACATEGCAAAVPEGLALEILQSMQASQGKRPSLKLARRTLRTLAWARWRRRYVIAHLTFGLLLAILGGIAGYIDSLTGYSRSISAFVVWSVRLQEMRIAEKARPWPTNPAAPRLDARVVRRTEDLYQTTNIWLAHLNFTREQWKALDAKYIGPMPNFMRPDGMIFLRNPTAQRSGLAGVFGYQFDWSQAAFEFAGAPFTNVAVRVKGNLGSLCTPKPSFKVDLNRLAKGQKLAGLDELTFNNLVWDYSCLHEALGYEFFRDSGVPAPRTAYAWLCASVRKRWDRKPLGLYLMLEPVDDEFAAERFGSENTPLFKPVTYNLFAHLGDDWSAYAPIYDLKTDATHRQKQRLIEFARLVSSATDTEFAAEVGDFLDLDEFARFLAGQVLLSNYDSILADGQNFYMYLHPRSNKFGFIPWDLDAAWGFFWLGEKQEVERASIWHPWVGENRFIERVMAVEEFRRIYRAHLEDFLTRLFVPDRLHRRIDEVAPVIRDPVAAESGFRLSKFDRSVTITPVEPLPGEHPRGINHPPYQLKRFIEARARSVRLQLDGKSKGVILKTPKSK